MISKETGMPGKSDLIVTTFVLSFLNSQARPASGWSYLQNAEAEWMGCLCSLPMHTFHTDAGCSPCAAGVPGILQKCMGEADLDMGVSKNRK